MAVTQQVAMSDREIHDYLARNQTAVASFATGDGPYAVPITYRYDPEAGKFYFRLIFPRRSEKRELIPDIPPCWLISYVEGDTRHESVIAKGQPVELHEENIRPEEVVQLGQTSRPLFEMWADSRAEVDIRLYSMEPTELTGRRIDIENGE